MHTSMTLDNAAESLIFQFRCLEYAQIAIYTFFVYDYLDLLPREFASIWRGKWAKINILYLACRYTTFFDFAISLSSMTGIMGHRLCFVMGVASIWVAAFGMILGQCVFFLRAYALWGTSRGVAVFLILLATGWITGGIVINVLVMKSTELFEPPINNPAIVPQCFLIVKGQAKLSLWGVIIASIIEFILVLMVIVARIRKYYHVDNNTLARKIYQDAIFYFTLKFLISMAAIALFFKMPGPVKQVSGIVCAVMFRSLACRFVLRMKEHWEDGLITSTITISALEFRHNDMGVDLGSEPPLHHAFLQCKDET